ncbi:MAG: hypothetical protein K0R18_2837, partial [Bacillales bacterium]|nr:hypothetical protein [Bacillales bacterium]
MDEPVFDSPIVENTTKTFNFTVTENISGKYRVVVDNKIIEEKEILYK